LTGSVVGIDMSIANVLADSGGEDVPSPRHGQKAAAKLVAAQQALARFPALAPRQAHRQPAAGR
jgi:putative transposase